MVFRGLTATHWQHAFLEFYRCLERLYSVSTLQELCDVLGGVIGPSELAIEMENRIGWRPKEDIAIIKLFKCIRNGATIPALRTMLLEAGEVVDPPAAVAKSIYQLRNDITHWRPAGALQDAPIDWDKLIGLICDVILDLYENFQRAFIE